MINSVQCTLKME